MMITECTVSSLPRESLMKREAQMLQGTVVFSTAHGLFLAYCTLIWTVPCILYLDVKEM